MRRYASLRTRHEWVRQPVKQGRGSQAGPIVKATLPFVPMGL